MNLSRSTQIAMLVAATFFMENLDATIIATAMPDMARSFGVAPVDLNIAMSSYMLALAAFIPVSGWLADRIGARVVFASAIALFSIASILCGLSSSLDELLASRVLQGISGAMMVPVGRLAVLRATDKKNLVKAIGYITTPALVAPVLGPPLGGLIVTYSSWPWIFYLNLPLGILALTASLYLIDNHTSESRMPFDWLGFILLGSSCAAMLWGVEEIGQDFDQAWLGLTLCLVSILLGSFAVVHMRENSHPALNLKVLSIPTFRVSFFGASLFRISINTLPFLLPLMFQLTLDLSPLTSGLLVIAMFTGNLAMKAFTTWIIHRWKFRLVLLANGVIGIAAIAICSLLDANTDHRLIALVLFIGGLSRSLQFTAYNTLGFADVPQLQMSNASTLFSMAFQLSMGMGVAVGALVLRIATTLNGSHDSLSTADFHLAFLLVSVLAAIAMYDSWKLSPQAGAALLHR